MYLRMNVTTALSASLWPIGAALAEREKAHTKHGVNSIESKTDDTKLMLSILVEEVGEVARAINEEVLGNEANLADELVQVLAVARAWLDGLERS